MMINEGKLSILLDKMAPDNIRVTIKEPQSPAVGWSLGTQGRQAGTENPFFKKKKTLKSLDIFQ